MPRKPVSRLFGSALTAAENIIEFPRLRFALPDASKKTEIDDSLNQHELTSVKALTSYVAHNQNTREDVVRAYLQAEFNVEDLANLRRGDYERVIEFLVDLRCDLLRH
jgi:hypothetical protein